MQHSFWFLLLVFLLCGPVSAQAQQLAFPTAEGFGRFAVGGRGGKVYNINSLSAALGTGGSCHAGGCGGTAPFASGTVTYRDCLTDRFGVGPRTCVFRVGGTIDFGYSPTNTIVIPPYLTIAGQTAPGNGIMIRGMELSLYGPDAGAGRNAHDIIVRHIRMRNRYYGSSSQCNVELVGVVYGAYNVIVDHVSGGWNFRSAYSGAYNVKGVTFQWSLLSEGLQGFRGVDTDTCCSPPGAFCTSLSGASGSGGDKNNGLSYLHNYTVHYGDRIPVNLTSITGQVINNVAYNTNASGWVMTTSSAGWTQEPIVEYMNNYFQSGPQGQSTVHPHLVLGAGLTAQPPSDTLAANSHIYLSGNYHNILRPNNGLPETNFVEFYDWGRPDLGPVHLQVKTTRYAAMPVIPSMVSAAQARADVLAKKVGAYATTSPSRLDSIDLRAIRALQNSSSGTFDTTSTATLCSDGECGETGTYPAGTPSVDTDGDGMSDAWETAHGLNPSNAADGPPIAGNGYSNLENYLNEVAGDTPPTSTLLPPQLLAHWEFLEGTGPSTADTTGHDYTGTLISSPVRLCGLLVNGSTQYVSNDTLQWPAGQPITVALWVKTSGGTEGGAFSVGGSTERAGAHVPYSDNRLYWDYGASLLTGRLSTDFTPYLRSWTHVVFASNGTDFQAIYLNGALVASQTVASAPLTGLTGLEIGRYKVGTVGTAWYTGAINDFRLYTSVLTAPEITALYTATVQQKKGTDYCARMLFMTHRRSTTR